MNGKAPERKNLHAIPKDFRLLPKSDQETIVRQIAQARLQMPEEAEPKLDSAEKELFLKEWDLKEGQLTDQQILMAIKTGQL